MCHWRLVRNVYAYWRHCPTPGRLGALALMGPLASWLVRRSPAAAACIINRHAECHVLTAPYRRHEDEHSTCQPFTANERNHTAKKPNNRCDKCSSPCSSHRDHRDHTTARRSEPGWSTAQRTNAFGSFVCFTTAHANRHKPAIVYRADSSPSRRRPCHQPAIGSACLQRKESAKCRIIGKLLLAKSAA